MNQELEFPLGPDEAAPTLEVARAPLSGAAMATYDAYFQTPACLTPATACDTGTLVDGRGPSGPEANAPNTLFSSCADGTLGLYHWYESLDRVRIYTQNGGGFLAGKRVVVEATLWAYDVYTEDSLVIYYAPNANAPQWTHVGTAQAPGPGTRVLSKTFTLSAGAELQAIRAIVRNTSTSGPCVSGIRMDRDDVVFRVGDMPPQVAMSSPGAVVSGTVTLSADVWDDFGVDLVNFSGAHPIYGSNFYLGSATQTPYQDTWNTAHFPDGPYAVTAKAWDLNNQTAVSTPFTVVVDNTAPSVTLTAPTTGAVLSGNVTLQASAQDGHAVERVEFYRDSTLLGTATQAPYQLTWNTADTADGPNYALHAKAYDVAGHVSTSSVTVTIENDPTGSITSPAPQAVLSGTATFAVNAQDLQGVDRVTFYVGTKYVTWDGTAPYTINFNTLNFTNGVYVLTARLFDTDDNMTVTEGVTVTIQN
ncbi:Ig-like domain-containing protein [Hyalangium sp.]|uniref:Ig-like domain-containing protein n=1 Tax=Hyalangium sp. TaxID=2028555 RepID=UPI002D644AC5|nr:Ig-like domain-containing protein [Hyalangium sp.]HYI00395.1 Ig-like domain-containing protein [Hyalangium sp.]